MGKVTKTTKNENRGKVTQTPIVGNRGKVTQTIISNKGKVTQTPIVGLFTTIFHALVISIICIRR